MANIVDIIFRANTTSVKKGLKDVDKSMEKSEKSAKSLTKVIGGLAAAYVGIGALKKIISINAQFGRTMAELRGVTGATSKELERMKVVAREMGSTTEFSAKEAAEGMLALSRAGLTVNQTVAALPATLNLALAGTLELGRASEITSNTLKQFNLSANQAARVSDVLVNSANSANTNVALMAESLKFAGVTAGTLGLSVEETAAAIGVLGDKAIQGGMAGRGLGMVLLNLMKTTPEAEKAFRRLGLSLEDVNPETVGLTGALQALRDANMDAKDAADIFGKENVKTALALTGSIEKMKELTAANRMNTGVAKENADIMGNTLAGAIKGFKSAMEEAALATGDKGLAGAIRSVVDIGADLIRVVMGMNEVTERGQFFFKFWTETFVKGIALAKEVWITLGVAFKDGWEGIKVLFDRIINAIGYGIDVIVNGIKVAVNAGISFIGDLAASALSNIADLSANISDMIENLRGPQGMANAFQAGANSLRVLKNDIKDVVIANKLETKTIEQMNEELKAANKLSEDRKSKIMDDEMQKAAERINQIHEEEKEALDSINKKYAEQKQGLIETGESAEEAFEKVAKGVERATGTDDEGGNEWKSPIQEYVESWKSAGFQIETAIVSVANTMQGAMSQAMFDMIKGNKNFSQAVGDLWKSLRDAIIRQITDMIAKWLVFMALRKIGSFGVFESGGMVFEKGGLIPSFASGGAVPIIAHAGEYVIPADMVDSIRRNQAVPAELVSAISSNRPPQKGAFENGGLVSSGNTGGVMVEVGGITINGTSTGNIDEIADKLGAAIEDGVSSAVNFSMRAYNKGKARESESI